MDTKKLRQKILDLAIRGKLVPQDPNDEPASVLLERIRAEKERLIKEGKIKKSKTSKTADTPHYENVPFEVPKGWCWCKLKDIMEFINGRAYKKEELLSSGKYKVLRVGNFFTNNSWYYSNLELTEDKYCYKGDLLYAWSASFGPKIWDGDKTIFHYHIWNVKYNHSVAIRDYLFYFLLYDKNQISKSTTGSTMVHVSMENMKPRFIPLPPLKEQQRIVAEIEHWFTLINQIEQGKAELQTSIKQAKSKILDLAIHGKLVPQDPTDEPASELLKRINPKAEITCDNGQYGKLPEKWVWTTVKDISKSILYGVSESAKSEGKYKLLRITDIQNNQVDWKTVPFTDFDDNKVSSYILHDGDIVFARTGATVGKSYLIKGLSQKAIYASYLIRVRTFDLILPEYVKLFFESGYYWEQIELSSVGIGQPNVNGTILGNLNIPLPPLAEQHRIVAKIEELFTSLDNIQKALEV